MIPAKRCSQSPCIASAINQNLASHTDVIHHISYALSELQKDVNEELLTYPEEERAALRAATKFGIFVVHNKLKPKLAELPAGTPYVDFLFI
jgi:hypothetical protein